MKNRFLTVASAALLISACGANAQEAMPWQNGQPDQTALAVETQPSPMDQNIYALQREWAHIKYEVSDEDTQETQMEALAAKASQVSATYPNAAEPKIWEAIILSSQAGIKGGLGALSLVEKARNLLLAAEKINPNALDGSIYTSLGSLYYQVPGWPVGFGDDDKARAYLEQARAINPNGIDPNYFYGDFLVEEEEYEKAVQVLEHALQAPTRPNRPVADAGRRQEIQVALEKAKKKLGK